MTREGSGISYLWILSWNGIRGKFLNEIDLTTEQSTLVSVDKVYDLVDLNKDGIMEIHGEIDSVWQKYFPNHNPITLPYITYTWNGNKYDFFPGAHQISENEFYPADLMGVLLRCNVVKTGNNYIYDYSITNQPSSKQSIEDIYISGLEDTSSNYASGYWRASSSSYIGGRYFYNSTYDIIDAINPGQTLSGIGTVSVSHPTIVKYYVQGFRHYYQTATVEENRDDIYSNSVSGYTIGTSDTSQPFILLNFLDTLTSYTTQSRALGWLKTKRDDDCDDDERPNDGVAKNIEKRIEKAKKELIQGDSSKARKELEKLVKKVERMYKRVEREGRKDHDREATITSEAYALLKYNAEYLIERLPEKKPKKGEED